MSSSTASVSRYRPVNSAARKQFRFVSSVVRSCGVRPMENDNAPFNPHPEDDQEKGLLGACFLEPALFPKVRAFVGADDFSTGLLRQTYRAMETAYDRGARGDDLLFQAIEIGNLQASVVSSFTDLTPSRVEAAVILQAKAISYRAGRRNLAYALHEAQQRLAEGHEEEASLQGIEKARLGLEARKAGAWDWSEHCASFYERQNPPPPDYLVEPYFERGTPIIFAAAGGTGKGLIGISFACAIADGKDWFGLKVPRAGNAVIVSGEDSENVLKRRIKAYRKQYARMYTGYDVYCFGRDNFPKGKSKALVLRDRASGEYYASDLLRSLASKILSLGPSLVIFDPLSCFFSGNLIAQEDTHGFMDVMTDIFCNSKSLPVLCIAAHVPKGRNFDASLSAEAVKGNGDLKDSSRATATFAKPDAAERDKVMQGFGMEGDASNYIAFAIPKNNNGRELPVHKCKLLRLETVRFDDGQEVPLVSDTGIVRSTFSGKKDAGRPKKEEKDFSHDVLYYWNKGLSRSEIRAKLKCGNDDMVRATNALVDKKFMEKRKPKPDSQIYKLFITETGIAYLNNNEEEE